MKQIKAQDFPRNDEAGYPMVGWELDDDHKLSFGTDGEDDQTWICYLAIPGEDLYCEVELDEIANFGRMLVQMVEDARYEEARRLAEARRNVDERRASLWRQR